MILCTHIYIYVYIIKRYVYIIHIKFLRVYINFKTIFLPISFFLSTLPVSRISSQQNIVSNALRNDFHVA